MISAEGGKEEGVDARAIHLVLRRVVLVVQKRGIEMT